MINNKDYKCEVCGHETLAVLDYEGMCFQCYMDKYAPQMELDFQSMEDKE